MTNPDGSRYETDAADPLTLAFDVDPSLVQIAGSLAAVTFYRDGVLVPDCGPGGLAVLPGPDPVCVSDRIAPGTIRILTTHASLWNLAVKVTPGSLCGLTKQLVQASAGAKGANLASAACKHLDAIVPGIKPAQKAAMVKAYGNAVDALANPGQRVLTATQAARLRTLAAAL